MALIALAICLLASGTIVLEFYRGTRVHRLASRGTVVQAFLTLIRRNRRRYGGYIIHFGVVLIFVGITGSSAYQIEQDLVLHPGASAAVGTYTLQYAQLTSAIQPTYEGVMATIQVSRHGRRLTTLYPEKRLYFAQNQPTTEVALRTSLFDDLYVILAGFDPSGVATFKVFVNPLLLWLWIGGFVIVLGTIIALWPERSAARPRRRRAPVPVGTA